MQAECVGYSRSGERVPGSAGVGRVPELLVFGDEVRAVRGMRVVVEGDETFFGVDLRPGPSFVTGLPDGAVSETDEDSL